MGHTVNADEPNWGDVETVLWDKRDNTMSGGTDPRYPQGKAEVQLAPVESKR